MRILIGAPCAVAWLALIWYAAPLLSRRIESLAERMRQAVVLGCGIGFALGFTGGLGTLGCWGAALALATVRALRFRALPPSEERAPPAPLGYAAVLSATVFAAWPSFVRPPTDGDTLIYHLPNAASWVHAGSVFTTVTHYWWYPGGSELFSAVMLCVGGIPLVPLAGACAYALLGLTSIDWCRERGLSEAAAALLTLVLITTNVAIVQSGDLQNDVWLSAFFAAGLYRLERGQAPANGTLATLALLKPIGWIFAALLALAAPRAARRIPRWALVAFVAWLIRDAVLAPAAVLPLPPFPDPSQAGTSIASHGIEGLRVLCESALRDGVATFALFAASLVCAVVASRTRLGMAAIFAWAVFLLVPFGFTSGGIAQLAGGFTLRFGLPALSIGAFALAGWLARSPAAVRRCAMVASAVAAAAGARSFSLLYWNDAATHGMILVALVAFVLASFAAWMAEPPVPSTAAACALLAGLIYAWRIQSAQSASAYYRDQLGEAKLVDSLPSYLERTSDARVVTVGFPLGMFDVLAPQSLGIDGFYAADVCREANRMHATLVVHLPGASGSDVLASTQGCGRTLWQNGVDRAIAPSGVRE